MIDHQKGPGLLYKYTWIINKIRGNQLSFAQISDAWEKYTDISNGNPLPKRTFDNWRYAIYDIFGIDIKCNNHAGGGYRYYIDDTSDLDNDELKKWMFNTFSVGGALIHNQSISDRILLEEVPKGEDLLPNILTAMKENRAIEVTHHSFYRKHACTLRIHPYCIKMFRQRWYLIARIAPPNGKIRSFALDRIEKLKVLDEKFKLPEDWNSKEFFKNAFGIIVNPDARIERVRLKVDASQANYFRSLPLHASQVEEEKTGVADRNHGAIEITSAPNYSLTFDVGHTWSVNEKWNMGVALTAAFENPVEFEKEYSMFNLHTIWVGLRFARK